ncbi:hypothetical protein TH728_02835 [Corynebacterium amycolatum]|uniref:hypothetical protein n=1 Tax=Corynebacterium amycolatum TaxID=43765 RepID=UPI002AAD2FA9|nr:hypothetical protein [Corynebacterium amycolatum]MDY7341362.1 hypothetical protein [Corynebacterium amycolatum]
MRTCCVEGCNAPAAALGACTTHLGLNGGPRVVPVPLEEKWKQRSRGLSRPEEDFAAKLREVPGRALPVPAGVMPFRTVVSPRKECDRTVKRVNKSVAWSRLPGMYRARSRDGVVFAVWRPEEEEEVVVAGEVSKRYA